MNFTRFTIGVVISVVVLGLLYWFRLDKYPVHFSRDEASVAYNAYSILKTGRDEWGVRLPLHFKGPGDYPPGLAFYLTVPFIWLFGLTETASRLPAACFGLINCLIVYLLVRRLHQDKATALLAALFTGLSPLHLINARSGSEVIFAYGFSLLTLYFFLSHRFLLSSFTFFLALISYLSARLYLPLLLLTTFWFLIKQKTKIHMAVLVGYCLLAASLFVIGNSNVRFHAVSIFSQAKTSLPVVFTQDALLQTPFVVTRLFHNQFTFSAKSFLFNFLDYLSLRYLFTEGGLPTRFKINETGILLFAELPFLLIGILTLYNRNRRLWLYLLAWIVISILPAAITIEYSPNVRRAFTLLFPLTLFVAIGIKQVYLGFLTMMPSRFYPRVIFASSISLLVGVNLLHLIDQVVVHTQFGVAMRNNYAYHQFIQDINQMMPDYDHIYWTSFADNPYIFYAFYSKLDPTVIQATANLRPENFAPKKWQLGKITFDLSDCPYNRAKSTLYIGKGDVCINDKEASPHITLLKSYTSPATPVYDIYVDKVYDPNTSIE